VKAEVRVLCRSQAGGGFALAGLRVVPAAPGSRAEQALRDLARRSEIGVVLIEDALYDGLPPELHRQLARHPLPMVVPFPGPRWVEPTEGPEAYIVELLRQVIGYRVKLR